MGLKVSWTLVVELSFYAFVPVWAFVVRRIAPVRHALTVEVGGALGLIAVGYFFSRMEFFGHLPAWATVLPPNFSQ